MMTSLPDPLVEACALARLIEVRAQAIAGLARTISQMSDTDTVKPDEWRSFSNSFGALLSDLRCDIETFTGKAEFGT